MEAVEKTLSVFYVYVFGVMCGMSFVVCHVLMTFQVCCVFHFIQNMSYLLSFAKSHVMYCSSCFTCWHWLPCVENHHIEWIWIWTWLGFHAQFSSPMFPQVFGGFNGTGKCEGGSTAKILHIKKGTVKIYIYLYFFKSWLSTVKHTMYLIVKLA